MCGRFVQSSPLETLQHNFNIRTATSDIIPNYNVAPTQKIIAIIKHNNENTLVKLHWGLVPSWAKDVSMGSRMINARAETVASKPSFRHALKKRRCLIPADGFYEWKGEKGKKQPYYVTIFSDRPFAFAGLWESWTYKEKDDESVYKSCAIITTAASESIRDIHHRMPVILNPDHYEKWLKPEIQDPKELEIILQDGIIRDMKYYPVSKRVNSVKNNDPNCIKPVDENL
jgi:putative SOS response-associated peptidase YedK